MIEFKIDVTENLLAVLAELNATAGSHITFTTIDGILTISSMSPEYYKIYKTDIPIEDDFSIRISKKMLKPLVTGVCTLAISISTVITIKKFINNHLSITTMLPLEHDFNHQILDGVLKGSKNAIPAQNLYTLSALRAILPLGSNGIQFKDGLAYIHGNGYIIYYKVAHPIDFIMTQHNLAELIRFINSQSVIHMYEVNGYVVFAKGNHYFGCRVPVNFIDSEYDMYIQLQPHVVTRCNLIELHNLLKNIAIPKGESPTCKFYLENSIASIDMGTAYHFSVNIGVCNPDSTVFEVPLELLRQILTHNAFSYESVELAVYDTVVSFRIGGIDMIISRSFV